MQKGNKRGRKRYGTAGTGREMKGKECEGDEMGTEGKGGKHLL